MNTLHSASLLLQLWRTVLDILVLIHLTGARVLELFYDLGRLISLTVDLCFFGYSLLASIFDHGLLADRLAHSTTSEAAETARLEAGETSTAAKAPSEEVVIIHHHHLEGISALLLLQATAATSLLAGHGRTHAPTHLTEEAGAAKRLPKASTEKVVIIVEKACKRVSATEELLENVIGIAHIE